MLGFKNTHKPARHARRSEAPRRHDRGSVITSANPEASRELRDSLDEWISEGGALPPEENIGFFPVSQSTDKLAPERRLV